MTTLQVRLIDLFLIVHNVKDTVDDKKKRSVVLLPRGPRDRPHETIISGPFAESPFAVPPGSDIVFLRASTELSGVARHTKPTAILKLDVVGKKFDGRERTVVKALVDKSQAAPASLNARVWLPEGLEVLNHANKHPRAEETDWEFRKNERRIHTQKLGDILNMGVQLPNGSYSLLIRSEDGFTALQLEPEDGEIDIRITNRDTTCQHEKPAPGTYDLNDFGILYKLTNEGTLPLPHGVFIKPTGTRSDCLPICGGAECDPPPDDSRVARARSQKSSARKGSRKK